MGKSSAARVHALDDDDDDKGVDDAEEAAAAAHDRVLRWDFDVTREAPRDNVTTCVRVLFRYFAQPTGFDIPEACLRGYVEDVRTNTTTSWVDEVPLYHNFDHGVDVLLQATYYAFVAGARDMLTAVDMLGLAIAALGHDVSHPGLNNAYHVNTQHDLAIRYSDASVLEAHSAAVVAAMLRDHQVLARVPEKDFRRIRTVVCASILGTDMSIHFKTMERLAAFVETHPWAAAAAADASCVGDHPKKQRKYLEEPEDRKFLCDVLLHCADVSNPSRPWEICKKWSDRVVEEFFRQGDKERALGLPISPNCNRETASQPTLSIGFSDFVVKPLFVQVATILPVLDDAAIKHLAINRERWQELKNIQASSSPPTKNEAPNNKKKKQKRMNDDDDDGEILAAAVSVDSVAPRETKTTRASSRKQRMLLVDRARGSAGGVRTSVMGNSSKKTVRQKQQQQQDTDARKQLEATRLMISEQLQLHEGVDIMLKDESTEKTTMTPNYNNLVTYGQDLVDRLYDAHQSRSVQTLFFLITVVALVGNSFRYAFLSPKADTSVNVVLAVVLFLFASEIALLCVAEKGYRSSATVAFDVVGAASLVLDVPWLQGGRNSPIFAQQAKAARGTTRVARAVRLIRFVRFVRLVRVARAMRAFIPLRRSAEDEKREKTPRVRTKDDEASSGARTTTTRRNDLANMGSKLSELLSRRTLLLLLLVLLVVPYLEVRPDVFTPQVQLLRAMANMTHAQRVFYVDTQYERKFDVLYLRIGGYEYVPRKTDELEELRFNERVTYEEDYAGSMMVSSSAAPTKSKVIQNYRATIREAAVYDILLITFISLLLVASSYGFSQIAEDVVVLPVDRMLRLVSKVARALDMLRRDAQQGDVVETDFLEHSIGKISEILQFGFGTTLSMLGESLSKTTVASVESVNVEAAFVFLDMHNYHASTRTNEVLSEAIFSYVNVVAHVVREAVAAYHGGEARSTGNSFLLVWRSKEDANATTTTEEIRRPGWNGLEYVDLPEKTACDLAFKTIARCALDTAHLNSVADKAKDVASQLVALNFSEEDEHDRQRLVSRLYATLNASLNRVQQRSNGEFKRTRTIERTAAKLEKYGCALVFASGLHYGAAIETRPSGAEPADYADCFFVSPDVNLAAKLEAVASGVYGCTMIMSGQFVAHLSPQTRLRTRQVDRARLKRTDHPVTLHTYDFLPLELQTQYARARPFIQLSELAAIFDFETPGLCEDYLRQFRAALDAYLHGDWASAYHRFEKVAALQPTDAPPQAIMSFMATHGNTCPPSWRGYRDLS
ncbi:hypothetical protein CTAYLR_001846 [Chrysophaeum taylorii]|uniref:Phosphodiesterase n=1 Tax=Chrysophaeum taylorii TaxID=2483200 RepID=A0AAD7U9T2_9STRA|nr:hypothetical protein CTAYLR_001846 [Chrysophaeum taylorii]